MPFTPEPGQPDFNRLKVTLLKSGLQQKDNPLYQVIDTLIDYVRKFQQNTSSQLEENISSINLQNFPIIQNIPGMDGNEGEQGEQGIPGTIGRDGVAGIAGGIGSIGPPGIDGEDGIDGEMGPVGPMGGSGPTGSVGPSGMTGPPGIDGIDGADGTDGIDGLPGKDGEILLDETAAVFVSKIGLDANNGLAISRAKLTIGSALTAAATLIGAGATKVFIHILDGGTYTENITVTSNIVIYGSAATLVGTIILNDGSEVYLDKHFAAVDSSTLVDTNTASGDTSFYSARIIDGRGTAGTVIDTTLIVNSTSGRVLMVNIGVAFVPQGGIGIRDATPGGGFGHVHFFMGDLYLAGNNAQGLRTNNATTNLIGYIDHILEVVGFNNTRAIVMVDAGSIIKITLDEIIADIVYDVSGGGDLYIVCPKLTGEKIGHAVFDLTEIGKIPGPIGPSGMDGEDGLDGFPIVGPPGPAGTNGIIGRDGLQGPPGIDAEEPELPYIIPGERGPAGPAGSGGITLLRTTGNQTINAGAATFVDITGLTFPVVNGVDYAFQFYITFRSANAATGWKAGVNCPAGTLDFWAGSDVIANGAAGVATHTERHNVVRDDMTLLTATVTAGVDLAVRISGRYLCTANGTFAARFANELAANTDIVVQKGSWGFYF